MQSKRSGKKDGLKRKLDQDQEPNRPKRTIYDDPQPSTSKGAPTRNPHGFRVFNQSNSSSSSSSIKDFFSKQIAKSSKSNYNEKYCVICQVPFEVLPSHQSKETHVTICMDTDYSVLPPCNDSLSCDSRARVHYLKFSHMQLAEFRSFQDKPYLLCDDDSSSSSLPHEISRNQRDGYKKKDASIVSNWSEVSKMFEEISPTSNLPAAKHDRNDNVLERQGSDDLFFDAEEASESNDNGKEQSSKQFRNEDLKSHDDQIENRSMELTCVDFDKKTSSESLTSSFSELDDIPFKTKAVEKVNGDMKVEIRLNPKTSVNKLCIKIPHEDEKKQKTINVQAHRSQSTITSFFLSAFSKDNKKEKIPLAKPRPQPAPAASIPLISKSKQCPFYKKIPNSSYAVDAFDYGHVEGVTKYFLSHFHYDHYRGLSKHWSSFPIYCSPITSRLIQSKLRVDPKWIRAIDLNQTHVIDNSVEVRLLDANHCPGAVMFVFRFLTTGQVILHCGDFRASPEMEEYPTFWNWRVSKVFLDTTYCQPDYDFPCQSEVVQKTVQVVKQHLEVYPKTLVCVGSYTIGKERIYMAIAEALDCKIYASNEKAKILKLLKDPIIEKRLTSIPSSARIHVIEMGMCRNRSHLTNILQTFSLSLYDKVLSIIPTGWNQTKGGMSSGIECLKVKPIASDCFVFEVPYSEHSSFSELKRFIKFLKLSSEHDIVPTVNVGNPEYRNQMKSFFRQWVIESK